MSRIYIIRDGYAESLVSAEDIEGFREYVESEGLMWQSKEFVDESTLTNFVAGLYHGIDERSPVGFAVLYDCIVEDMPFIEILINQ